jgi:effector-binding domain-containing protein
MTGQDNAERQMTSTKPLVASHSAGSLLWSAVLAALCAAWLAIAPTGPAFAQTPPAPATPAAPPSATQPQTAPPAVQQPGEPGVEAAQTVDVPARAVALTRGSSTWDDGFKSITTALSQIQSEMQKAGLAASGHAFTVFVETDDAGFRYEAMIPLAAAPEGKTELTKDVKLGSSPSGKAMKFQHRGPYDDIDATYEAITAYLDEKNIEAQNLFIEEYLTDPKTSDDASLEVDIYVFIKG